MSKCAGVLVFASVAAFAQAPRPTMVLAPMEFDPNPSLTKVQKVLEPGFFDAVRTRAGVTMASKPESDAALKELKRQDFRDSNEALAKLADRAGMLYGLHVLVTLVPQKVGASVQSILALSARVVRSDGKLMKTATVSLPRQKDTVPEVFGVLTTRLLDELVLKDLPTFIEAPPVETPPVPAKVVEVPGVSTLPPPPLPPIDDGAGQRLWGKVGVGGGVGVFAVGALMLGLAASDNAALHPVNRNLQTEAELNTAHAAVAKQTAGIGLMIGGAVVAGAGAALWYFAPKAPAVIGFVPLQSGGELTFGGNLP